MGNLIDLTGEVFGRLEVIHVDGFRLTAGGKRQWMWMCKCECGKGARVVGSSLRSGNTRSCGCIKVEDLVKRSTKHGMSYSKEYLIYHSMVARCTRVADKGYKNYGGRGITVCDRWLESFENFYEDMGDKPDNLSLDREDNDGGYCPANCRWATDKEQANNNRGNHMIEFDGRCMNLTQWAEELGMARHTLSNRLNNYGWSVGRALTEPVHVRYGK